MKFAICQELFEGWDWERQCRFISEVGYTGVEVAPFTINEDAAAIDAATLTSMKQTAEAHGLEIVGLHWLLAKTEGLHLTTADDASRNRTAEYLVTLGKMCAALGGSLMVFGSPFQRSLQDGMSTAQAIENAAGVFGACLPQIADLGVSILMEPLTDQETDFINTCEEASQLIAMVDQPNFRLHQDVKAMLGAEKDPLPDVIHRYKHLTGHFHANDSNLRGPGMGETDYVPIFRALRESGYEGWVSVEVFDYSPGAEETATLSLNAMRDALAAC